jgi:hypothetical protein
VSVHAPEATEQVGEDGAAAGGETGAGVDEITMPTTLLLPCTHGLCLQCAIQLRESVKGIRESERRRGKNPKRKYACPVCRRGELKSILRGLGSVSDPIIVRLAAYTSMLHIATADEKNAAQNVA